MYTATWNGRLLARGNDVIDVEGRLYFRPRDVDLSALRPAPETSFCEWKGGSATYFNVVAAGDIRRAAAWSYARTGPAASDIAGRIAFWHDIIVGWDGEGAAPEPMRLEAMLPNVAKALGSRAVVWRPTLPPALLHAAGRPDFPGYLIVNERILVDVVDTPPEPERPARIDQARAFAQATRGWNTAHPDQAFGYVAVWGSATPDAAVIAALRSGALVVALTQPAEMLAGKDTDGQSGVIPAASTAQSNGAGGRARTDTPCGTGF